MSSADDASGFLDYRVDADLEKLLNIDQPHAAVVGELVVIVALARSANADLDDPFRVEQSFFGGAAEGRAVVIFLDV